MIRLTCEDILVLQDVVHGLGYAVNLAKVPERVLHPARVQLGRLGGGEVDLVLLDELPADRRKGWYSTSLLQGTAKRCHSKRMAYTVSL